MYTVIKDLEISACHRLNLNYASKCTQRHGHNWHIRVICESNELNENGMVVDFTHIKQFISDMFDHQDLNEKMDVNPTAENIAQMICDNVANCVRVEVQESDGNLAIYDKTR